MSGVGLNRHCSNDSECRASQENSQCSKLLNICQCRKGFLIVEDVRRNPVSCEGSDIVMSITTNLISILHLTEDPTVRNKDSLFVDPVSIGILVVLALMFLVICMVLQLFSRSEILNLKPRSTLYW